MQSSGLSEGTRPPRASQGAASMNRLRPPSELVSTVETTVQVEEQQLYGVTAISEPWDRQVWWHCATRFLGISIPSMGEARHKRNWLRKSRMYLSGTSLENLRT